MNKLLFILNSITQQFHFKDSVEFVRNGICCLQISHHLTPSFSSLPLEMTFDEICPNSFRVQSVTFVSTYKLFTNWPHISHYYLLTFSSQENSNHAYGPGYAPAPPHPVYAPIPGYIPHPPPGAVQIFQNTLLQCPLSSRIGKEIKFTIHTTQYSF